jgi:uncharacterized membrane-anchored protein YhcB (DUF1043 family)
VDGLLAAITWERLLALWGILSTPIAWYVTQRLERKKRSEQWQHEDQLRREQVALEEKKRQAEREHTQVDQLRERMRDTYTRFLSGASAVVLATDLSDEQRVKALADALPGFNLSYHQLLLVASTASARQAVQVWKSVNQIVSLSQDDPAMPGLEQELKQARSRFVTEAHEDLEDPVRRSENPAWSIEPVIKAGGFHLEDVG